MRLSTPRCYGRQLKRRQKGKTPVADSVPTLPTHPREHNAQRADGCGFDAQMRIAYSAFPVRHSRLRQLRHRRFHRLFAAFTDLSTHPSTECAVRLNVLCFTVVFFSLDPSRPCRLSSVLAVQKAVSCPEKRSKSVIVQQMGDEEGDLSVRRTTDCTLYDATARCLSCVTFPAQDRLLMGVTRCGFLQVSIDHWAEQEERANSERATCVSSHRHSHALGEKCFILDPVFEHFEDPSGVALRSVPRMATGKSSLVSRTRHRSPSLLRPPPVSRTSSERSASHLSATPSAPTTLCFLPFSAAAAFLRSTGVSARRSGNTSSRAQEDRPENQKPCSREGHTSTCPRQRPPLYARMHQAISNLLVKGNEELSVRRTR